MVANANLADTVRNMSDADLIDTIEVARHGLNILDNDPQSDPTGVWERTYYSLMDTVFAEQDRRATVGN